MTDMIAVLKEKAKEVEGIIYAYLPKVEGYQKTCFEAMQYSVHAPGKRIRPILMLETYRMFGGKSNIVAPFMAALEFIHTYSLVHDDLPAMDNDDYRRGQLTTHKKYGEAMGVLAGDALLNYAYEVAVSAFELLLEDTDENTSVSPYNIAKALQILSNKAGIYGMVGGQVVDVENEGKAIELPMLDFIYRLKTGALLESAMMIGATLANATEKEIEIIQQIALKVGIAFQIQDDILDITSTTEVLGKPVGSDEKNQKETYALKVGLEAATKQVEELTNEAIALLDGLNYKNEFLRELLIWMIHREK